MRSIVLGVMLATAALSGGASAGGWFGASDGPEAVIGGSAYGRSWSAVRAAIERLDAQVAREGRPGTLVGSVSYALGSPAEEPEPQVTTAVIPSPWNEAAEVIVIWIGGPAQGAEDVSLIIDLDPGVAAGGRIVADGIVAPGNRNGIWKRSLAMGEQGVVVLEVRRLNRVDRAPGTMVIRYTDSGTGEEAKIKTVLGDRVHVDRSIEGSAYRAAALATMGMVLAGERAEGRADFATALVLAQTAVSLGDMASEEIVEALMAIRASSSGDHRP